ncbi:hypothetical protein MJT46_015793 [Ovis ammon polii x Ovis aries]|nr:hypothetical protein MJT46_015793 [Ovis ammon polii x Ovis aries]
MYEMRQGVPGEVVPSGESGLRRRGSTLTSGKYADEFFHFILLCFAIGALLVCYHYYTDWFMSLGVGLLTFASLETVGIYFGLVYRIHSVLHGFIPFFQKFRLIGFILNRNHEWVLPTIRRNSRAGVSIMQSHAPEFKGYRKLRCLEYYSDIILYCLPLLCSGWKWPFHAPHSYSFLEKALLSPVIARTQLSVLAVVASVSSRELLAHRQSLFCAKLQYIERHSVLLDSLYQYFHVKN